jgi:hypothetical protein
MDYKNALESTLEYVMTFDNGRRERKKKAHRCIQINDLALSIGIQGLVLLE